MLNDLKAALRAGVNAFVTEWKDGARRRAEELARKRQLAEALAGLGEARTYIETILDRATRMEIDEISLKRFFEALEGKPITSQVTAVAALVRTNPRIIMRPSVYAWVRSRGYDITVLPQFNKEAA
jgi:hypothetical protein